MTKGTLAIYAGILLIAAAVILVILLAAERVGLKRRLQDWLKDLFDLLRAD